MCNVSVLCGPPGLFYYVLDSTRSSRTTRYQVRLVELEVPFVPCPMCATLCVLVLVVGLRLHVAVRQNEQCPMTCTWVFLASY